MPKHPISLKNRILNNKKNPLFIIPLIVLILLTVLGGALLISTNSKDNTRSQLLSMTDKSIETARTKLATNPQNSNLYANLCQIYLQKVRETADTAYYSKCDRLLASATKIDPNNAEVIAAKASVAYGRHSFKEGLELSIKAQQLNPNKVSYYGLIGDGQIELGQYEAAVQSYQIMVDKKPELGSYNRVAYARELYGDINGAISALESAISSGSSITESLAYSQVEQGKLYMRSDLDKAKRTYEQALRTSAGYPPALEGLGKIAFAKQDYTQASKYFQQAFDALPIAQYAINLGDTYKTQGNIAKADQQYYLAQLAFDQSASSGVNTDYEISTFLSSRGKETERALRLATNSTADRPNIFSYDALSMALYRAGNYQEAQAQNKKALILGEHEPVFLYHSGLIADKLSQSVEAKQYFEKALAADKYFVGSHFSLLDKEGVVKALNRLK